jgi:hypothetical protein
MIGPERCRGRPFVPCLLKLTATLRLFQQFAGLALSTDAHLCGLAFGIAVERLRRSGRQLSQVGCCCPQSGGNRRIIGSRRHTAFARIALGAHVVTLGAIASHAGIAGTGAG